MSLGAASVVLASAVVRSQPQKVRVTEPARLPGRVAGCGGGESCSGYRGRGVGGSTRGGGDMPAQEMKAPLGITSRPTSNLSNTLVAELGLGVASAVLN